MFLTQPFVTPAAAPFIIGLAYGNMVWGFGGNTISTNLARDLGTRIVALIFYGREAFTYMGYTPVAVLVNIPATLFATAYYEVVLRDSFLIIRQGHAQHEEGDDGLMRYISKTGIIKDDELRKMTSNGDANVEHVNIKAS